MRECSCVCVYTPFEAHLVVDLPCTILDVLVVIHVWLRKCVVMYVYMYVRVLEYIPSVMMSGLLYTFECVHVCMKVCMCADVYFLSIGISEIDKPECWQKHHFLCRDNTIFCLFMYVYITHVYINTCMCTCRVLVSRQVWPYFVCVRMHT